METLRSFLSSSQPDEVEQLGHLAPSVLAVAQICIRGPEISAKKNLMPPLG